MKKLKILRDLLVVIYLLFIISFFFVIDFKEIFKIGDILNHEIVFFCIIILSIPVFIYLCLLLKNKIFLIITNLYYFVFFGYNIYLGHNLVILIDCNPPCNDITFSIYRKIYILMLNNSETFCWLLLPLAIYAIFKLFKLLKSNFKLEYILIITSYILNYIYVFYFFIITELLPLV